MVLRMANQIPETDKTERKDAVKPGPNGRGGVRWGWGGGGGVGAVRRKGRGWVAAIKQMLPVHPIDSAPVYFYISREQLHAGCDQEVKHLPHSRD